MGDGIDERVLLFGSSDPRTRNVVLRMRPVMMAQNDDAEEERRDLPPRHDHPADVQGNGQGDERHAERDERRRSRLGGLGQRTWPRNAIELFGYRAIRLLLRRLR